MKKFLENQNDQLQMQLLQLPSNKVQKDNLRQEKLDTYLGMARGLTDPFNLFVNLTDIKDNRNLIYFFSYSMGVKKVVVWGTYDRSTDKIDVEAGCRYDTWKYILYSNSWRDMNYQIYTTLTKNKYSALIDKYVGDDIDPKIINNETDLKAWKYMLAYFDDNISEDDFLFLFDRLNTSELSYNYENYHLGKSPVLDFYELFNIDDFTEGEELNNVKDNIEYTIKYYEQNKLNTIDDRSPIAIKDLIVRIAELFLDYISRSNYIENESVKYLPICPQKISECDSDRLEDEHDECSIFTFGRHSFSPTDNRYGKFSYEEDLT